MYIVWTECVTGCCYNVVLGICTNMFEVTEIIWNYSRFILQKNGYTFEENVDLIQIAKISKEDYHILQKIYHKYEYQLDELKSSDFFNGWEPEEFMVNFWYGVFMDVEKEHPNPVFSKEDCGIIKKIIRNGRFLDSGKLVKEENNMYESC